MFNKHKIVLKYIGLLFSFDFFFKFVFFSMFGSEFLIRFSNLTFLQTAGSFIEKGENIP